MRSESTHLLLLFQGEALLGVERCKDVVPVAGELEDIATRMHVSVPPSRVRAGSAHLWYFQSDVRCETVSRVMPSAFACSYMTFSISSETADVHSSRIAYCGRSSATVARPALRQCAPSARGRRVGP